MAVTTATVVAGAMLINCVIAAQGAETLSGSGVVIGAKGEILTNAHVVDACQTITVKLASGNSETGAILARDERNDLAVVRLTGTNNPPASVAMFREGTPLRAGDSIIALGYPLSGVLAAEANVSVGNVSALAGIADDSRYVQISAPVQPGNSGGPLLDASGHLAGIVSAKLNAVRVARFTGDIPQNVNFALKSEVARTFLDSKGIAYQTARSDRQLSPADIGDIARPFTVRIECEQAGLPVATAPATPTPPLTAPGPDPTGQQIEWCSRSNKPSPDLVIKGCTAVIQSGQGSDSQRVVAFVSRGTAYYQQDAFDRAISDLTEAIRLNPKNGTAFGYRGMAYYKKRNFDRAISDYTQAIRLDWKAAFYFRGEAYSQKGDYDRAIADFSETIRFDQKDVLAFFARGNAYNNKRDYAGAFSDYSIVAKSERAPAEMAASAATGIGFLYENGEGVARDYAQAMHWFRIAADKGDAIAMSEIGMLYAEAKDCDSARQWTEKAAIAGHKGAQEFLRSRFFARCR
jgi:Tfp pilus assembly protein PilF